MIRFRPLAGFGIEAEGVDLAKPLADADFRALEAAFYVHQLNHQHNMVKFGNPMDPSRVKFGKPEKVQSESWVP